MKTNIQFRLFFAQSLQNEKSFRRKLQRKPKTRRVFNKFLAVYETMKNIVEQDRAQMTWCMHILCRITKATDSNPECVLIIALPLQQRLHEGATILRYTQIGFLVVILYSQPKHTLVCILYSFFLYSVFLSDCTHVHIR